MARNTSPWLLKASGLVVSSPVALVGAILLYIYINGNGAPSCDHSYHSMMVVCGACLLSSAVFMAMHLGDVIVPLNCIFKILNLVLIVISISYAANTRVSGDCTETTPFYKTTYASVAVMVIICGAFFLTILPTLGSLMKCAAHILSGVMYILIAPFRGLPREKERPTSGVTQVTPGTKGYHRV